MNSTPTLAAYAARHRLRHRAASFGLPKATQLMRHGFMQEVPSLAGGELPEGAGDGWLALVSYVYEGRNELERSPFTIALVGAPASTEYAIRVLCHDRGLDERDRSNPDADRQVVKLDDKAVRLESDLFLERYAVSTDHDQDQVSVWQLFSPGLILWLTEKAPTRFSFELQDGALCCFVPGHVTDEDELDALCAAAARILARVVAIRGPGDRDGVPGDGTRWSAMEGDLAEHPFASPPASVKAAAKHFRSGLRLGDRAWGLGAEAFFREHAALVGFEPIAGAAYRAAHLDTFLPGIFARAAQGRLSGGEEAFLVLTDSDDYDDMGWTNLIVMASPLAARALAQSVPRGDTSQRGSMQVGADGRSLILSTLDGGRQGRTAEEFGAFFAAATELAARLRPADRNRSRRECEQAGEEEVRDPPAPTR
ncbi:MAG: hypothetical protein JST08_05495 [Actinobacteria bacterium]|nr:hypothetical protein [Actinomycetota bacterium]